MELSLGILIIFTIFLLLSLYKLLSSSSNGRLPPGPTPLPIIGNIFDLDKEPHLSLARLSKVHGPVMSLKLGLTTTVVVSSPEAAREVFQKKDSYFSARSVPDSFHANDYHKASMLFLPSTSPMWKNYRTICATYLFSARSLETSQQIRAKKIHEIMQCFRMNAGFTVSIGQLILSGLLNVISNILFSQDVLDINSKEPQEFKKLVKELIDEFIKPNVSDFFPFLRLLDLQGRRRSLAVHIGKFYDFFGNLIDTRLEERKNNSGTKYSDFLDSLIDLFLESKISRQEIQSLLMELFVAGSDTSTITVEWTMAELLHNPDIMAKAQAEVRETFASQAPEEPDTVKLPYLQAVVKEVMRMHPPGPLLVPRKAMEDGLDICGYAVPKEARVMINVWAIARDPKVWKEPEVFWPERFLESDIDFQGRDFELLPFGSGRRACQGVPFFTRVVPYLLALMLRDFDWKLPDGMQPKDVDLTEKFASALELATPLQAVPVPVINRQKI